MYDVFPDIVFLIYKIKGELNDFFCEKYTPTVK